MMREVLGTGYTSGEDNLYEQLAMDVTTLEYGRSIDAMDDGYEQIEMSVMGGQLNTPEMMKNQAGVTGDTIYMGSISVYPPKGQGQTYEHNINGVNVQPYYDPNTGLMYMPMYPMYPYTEPVQATQKSYVKPVQPVVPESYVKQVQSVTPEPYVKPIPSINPQVVQQQTYEYPSQPVVQSTTINPPQEQSTVPQLTTMYPATSVTKMVDIFGEDKKYSQVVMKLQAESEYKVAVHLNTGKNGKRYMYNFSHMDKTKQLLNWNFGAFFFGPLWFAYRKMPMRALLLLVAFIYGISTPYALAVIIATPLLMGAFSDRIYKGRIDRLINKQFKMDKESKEKNVSNKGGESIIYIIMFLLVASVIAIGVYKYILPEVDFLKTIWENLLSNMNQLMEIFNR